MWGLAAWVERFQAELWVKQTGTPFTGRVGKFAVRAIWADVDQLGPRGRPGRKNDLQDEEGAREARLGLAVHAYRAIPQKRTRLGLRLTGPR